MKQVCVFLFLFLPPVLLFAQQTDTIITKKNAGAAEISPDTTRTDSSVVNLPDSIVNSSAQSSAIKRDTPVNRSAAYYIVIRKIFNENKSLNLNGKPVAMSNKIKQSYPSDNFFYLLAAVGMMLGFFRFFYNRYFNNLFRVFFNASLRQSQLTDQLLQAKLPSLFFNILFILAGGIYVYLLLRYYNWVSADNFWLILLYCTFSLALIYLCKFITVKFTGWLTGYKEVTNIYIFIIFLINKILGILLIPFSIIIAFSVPALTTAGVIISLLLISLMFLLRFFRSYGLLQNKLKISRFHFFMYVAGIEILPVLLIYKGLVLLLSKNL
ncbi:MAG: DUF4271 domain-containing protein [Ferruginibacter sp.]